MTAAERLSLQGKGSDENLRVLVVEDDESVRRLISRRLRQAGIEVLCAGSGEEAVQLCESGFDGAPPVHLVITDGIMPGMDGFELARWLGQRNPPMRVILISGFMGHFISRPDIPENIEAFFPKPFSGEELVAKVLDLLGAAA